MAMEKLNNVFHSLTVDVKDDEGRLLRIEIYMSIVVLLFICLAFFGWFRRISGSQFVRICLWAAYSSFYATLTYSLGLMSSAPFTNDLFAIWAIVILYMLDSTDSITAYSLQDNEHVYRCLWETFMAVIYVGIVVASNSKDSSLRISIWVLFLACIARPCIRFCALYLASKTSSWLSEATRVITDFMYEEHKIMTLPAPGEGDKDDSEAEKDLKNKNKRKMKNKEDEHPFFDVRGYHYIVKGDSERKAQLNKVDFKYSMLEEKVRDVITVHEIWSESDRFPSDSTGRLKDHCLSFALFKMLRRRFAGYCLGECTCPEARDKTWAFVADRLLKKMDQDVDQKSKRKVSKRVFGIVELELAFVFDFFYTKYAAMLEKGFPWWKSFAEVILLVYAILISVKLYTDRLIDFLAYPGVNSKDVVNCFANIVTHIVLYGFSATLLLQFYALLNSNWMKVWLLCKHFTTNSSLIKSTIRKVLSLVSRLQFVNLWSNRIGQHDLLAFPSHTLGRRLLQLFPIQTSQLPVPDEVKIEVLITLKKHGRFLTDGLNSGLPGRDKRKWTCELTEIGIAFNILVWHIVTSLMLTDYPDDDIDNNSICTSTLFAWLRGSSNGEYRHRKVARILSNYCAYLVASHPELLPDSASSTKLIYDKTREDLLHLLEGKHEEKHGSHEKLSAALNASPKGHNLAPILVKAEELYKKLKGEVEEKKRELSQIECIHWLWKVLSDYWTEMVLYLAPCDNPEEHIKSLTRGGEFITHLWALLTHAGVIKRVLEHDHNPYNRETDYQQI